MKMKIPLIAIAALFTTGTQAQAGAVIVAATTGAVAPLDAQQAKRLFLGREATVGGKTAVVIYQKGGTAKSAFETRVLNKTGADLTSYWAKLIFTGRANAPQLLDGDARVKAAVVSTPGAVGYVDDASVDSSVTVLFKF